LDFFRLSEATDVLFKALKLVEVTDAKLSFFATVHAGRLGHLGRAVKLVQV
jgi:hypothetical protein